MYLAIHAALNADGADHSGEDSDNELDYFLDC